MTKPVQLNNNIQDDATFTILKFEELDGGLYLLEAGLNSTDIRKRIKNTA
jgi:hypothetical protein